MKLIGIITIAHGTNYGNRLQNFALSKIISNYGFKVVTLKERISTLTIIHNTMHILLTPVASVRLLSLTRRRKEMFTGFVRQHIVFSQYHIGPRTKLSNLSDKFNYIVLGSDQIWNPNFRMINRATMFGYGLKDGQAVPYAPSFGTDVVIKGERKRITLFLNSLKYISVREEQGVRIVKELTGRDDAIQVLDPTLLLNAADYRAVECRPANLNTNKKYIVTYFLGEIPNNVKKSITELMKSKNLILIEFNNPANSDIYTYGPSEFLYTIDNAELILTDSFHATVFSIIFRRPFVVYDRVRKGERSMNSRIDTLLNITGLERRRNLEVLNSKVFSINYSNVQSRINIKKNESLNYLKKALSVK